MKKRRKNIKERLSKIKLGTLGKKQLILAGLIVMIAVAGYINLNYNAGEAVPTTALVDDMPVSVAPTTQPEMPAEPTYFDNARLERENSRSESMDIYREIIDNKESSSDAKAKAQENLSFCAKAIENETIIENLIKSKGFEEAVVYITSGGATVVVKTEGLIPAQVAQIKDMVVEAADISPQNIKITEIR